MSFKTIKAPIPLDFILKLHGPTWGEVEFGLRGGWMTQESAVALAIRRIEEGSDDEDELELGGVFHDEGYRVADILERLIANAPEQTREEIRLNWMRLLLAWLYENQPDDDVALEAIEEIYADFDYPNEIRYLVRYNPVDETTSGSMGAAALIRRWRAYLSEYFPSLGLHSSREQ